MSDDTKPTCCKWQYRYPYQSGPCGKPAKLEHEGKHYCGIHNPELVKAREAKIEAKRKAKDAIQNAHWARNSAVHSACAGVPTEQLRRGLLAELIEVAKVAGVWRVMCPQAYAEGEVKP